MDRYRENCKAVRYREGRLIIVCEANPALFVVCGRNAEVESTLVLLVEAKICVCLLLIEH